MAEKISIIIADDHVMFIDGLKALIHQHTDFEVVAHATDGKQLLELLKIQSADLLLLDINMPVLNGIEALKFIRQHKYKMKVIMLSTYNEAHLKEKTKSAGADGYIIKNFSLEQLIEAIRTVLQESKPYFPEVHLKPSEEFKTLEQYNLTKREREIIDLIRQGKTNIEMSRILFLSIYTIETHRKNIMHKLKLRSPMALMKLIVENNL